MNGLGECCDAEPRSRARSARGDDRTVRHWRLVAFFPGEQDGDTALTPIGGAYTGDLLKTGSKSGLDSWEIGSDSLHAWASFSRSWSLRWARGSG
jgi:hypothetical protein